MPEQPAPSMMTQPQLEFLRKIAHRVTGDGNGHVAAFMASHSHAVTTVVASAEIKRLLGLSASGVKAPVAVPRLKEAATTNAPPGRYAVDLPSGPLLVEVSKPTSGDWKGYTFVKTVPLLAEVAPEPVRGRLAVEVLRAIDANPRGCAGSYGRITGRCGLCHRRLADPVSVSLGIGPECMRMFDNVPQPNFETPSRRVSGAQPPERF
jgi:hypothetical protein